jgi:hypothetical protein
MSYHNRFERSLGWKRLRFLADDRQLQSAELNELQEMILSEMGELAKTVLEGDGILRGIEIVVNDDATMVTITAGQVFYDGSFHEFAGGSVAISGVGEEVVGLVFSQHIVSHLTDASLLNPASGALGFGRPGADRLRYLLALAVNDPNALPLYRLRDGAVLPKSRLSTVDFLYQLLARRTNDQSGSYMVRGLNVAIDERDSETFAVRVSAGIAYVLGWEIVIPADVTITVPRPLHWRSVPAEAKTFATGTDLYLLNSRPVRQVASVSAVVEKAVTVNRGFTPNGSDLMPFTPVVSIESVSQGGTTYSQGADYVVDGDYISWAPGGQEPATGSTYNVTLRYMKQAVEGVDWQLDGDYIDWSLAGDNPVNGTAFIVSYDRYLGRIDQILLDRLGGLSVLQGSPEVTPLPPRPHEDLLSLARVTYAPNCDAEDAVVLASGQYRLTMREIARLRERVSDLEYNVAVSALEQEALNVELASSKRAIFADGLQDFSRSDVGHADFSAAIHPDNTASPAFGFQFHDLGDSGRQTIAYTAVVDAFQRYATHLVNVNPYAAAGTVGRIVLSPPDDWRILEQTVIWNQNEFIAGSVFRFWEMLGRSGIWRSFHQRGAMWRDQWFGTIDEESSQEREVSGVSRSVQVAIAASQFSPNANNLKLFFDGQPISMAPAGGSVSGTESGTMMANSAGNFSATFMVPSGIPTGVKSVVVRNNLNEAENQFAIGQIVRTRHIRRRNVTIDPVAQTFMMPEDTAVARVGLWFGTRDASLPIFVEIRNVSNGYPGPDVLAETVVPASSVLTSNTASLETVVTFPFPAMCVANEEYCVVVGSESVEYQIWCARLGGTDVGTGEKVIANAAAGVMFTSANGRTWSADQAADLKFRLYRATFDAARVITFPPIDTDASILAIMASQDEPAGSRVTWEYSVGESPGVWRSIEPGATVDMGETASRVHTRATLHGNGRTSPALATPVGVVLAKWDAAGAYIGRNTEVNEYTSILLYADLNTPPGTSVTAQYSTNGGASWTSFPAGVLQRQVTTSFAEYKWTATGISNPAGLMVRINMASSQNRLSVPRIRRIRAIAT